MRVENVICSCVDIFLILILLKLIFDFINVIIVFKS